MHLLHSLENILARRHFRGAHMPKQSTNNARILLGTHLYTHVESSNVDKWWKSNVGLYLSFEVWDNSTYNMEWIISEQIYEYMDKPVTSLLR